MTVTLDDTLQTLTATFPGRGDRAALLQIGQGSSRELSYARLAEQARELSAGMRRCGLERGDRVLLLAPNCPEWVIACAASLEAGLVPVPLDSQMGMEDIAHVLSDSGARWIFTTSQGAQRLSGIELPSPVRFVLLDERAEHPQSWIALLGKTSEPAPPVAATDIAVIFYTSGTSGPPKGVPLTHRNIISNVRALLSLDLVHPNDRVLLPLPLHHVYPFVVGLLTPLLVGMSVVVPSSLVGQHFFAALRNGEPTILLGVPRLYEALYAAIEARFAARGQLISRGFAAAVNWSGRMQRVTGINTGRWLFWIVRRGVGRRIRMIISGGAALDKEIAARLEGLGFRLAFGYGLTETSPILTFRSPAMYGADHVGEPLPGVELRVTAAEQQLEFGEVQARGPNVFAGYLNLPESTRLAFTEDGWFRTGDLGFLDDRGYLHLRGRVSSMIVMPGGENVNPEKVELELEKSPVIREAGVLEHGGHLAAVIVPAQEAVRGKRAEDVLEAVRAETALVGRRLPSYQRLNDLVVDSLPLPRTRLGKLRRRELAHRYEELAEAGSHEGAPGLIAREHLAPLDRELLEDRIAARVWSWLGERFAGQQITFDTNLQLDLGVDSLEWLNLSLEIRNRAGIDLTDEAIGRIETVRDLLQEATGSKAAAEFTGDVIDLLGEPDQLLTEQEQSWLEPQPLFERLFNVAAAYCAIAAMRILFRIRVTGREHLPNGVPFVVAPNHLSALDPIAVAAALGPKRFRDTYWGGWVGIMFKSRARRALSHALRVLPIEPRSGPLSNLALAAAVLKRQGTLVWFPEGERSRDGSLMRFRPGISLLMRAQGVMVVPTWIEGTASALPPGRTLPRPGRISLRFGAACDAAELESEGRGSTPEERIADGLRSRVRALGESEDPS